MTTKELNEIEEEYNQYEYNVALQAQLLKTVENYIKKERNKL